MSLLIGLLIAASAAAAQEPITVTAPAQDPIVCKRSKHSETGSRMAPRRICKAKSEWLFEEQQTQRTLRKLDDRFNAPPAVPGGRGN